jgi:hypothetical protein
MTLSTLLTEECTGYSPCNILPFLNQEANMISDLIRNDSTVE